MGDTLGLHLWYFARQFRMWMKRRFPSVSGRSGTDSGEGFIQVIQARSCKGACCCHDGGTAGSYFKRQTCCSGCCRHFPNVTVSFSSFHVVAMAATLRLLCPASRPGEVLQQRQHNVTHDSHDRLTDFHHKSLSSLQFPNTDKQYAEN